MSLRALCPRLSRVSRREIVDLFAAGDVTLDEAGELYGLPRAAVEIVIRLHLRAVRRARRRA